MVRRLPSLLGAAAIAVIACGKSGPAPMEPDPVVPFEPLFSVNTACYASYTFDLEGFGDSTRLAEADTSYLVIHGLTDSLVGTTSGSAWLVLAADGWGARKDQWHRMPSDSLSVGFKSDSSRHEFHLALYEEAAAGVGREFEKTLDDAQAPVLEQWDMVLSRIHCSGLREPTDPPFRKPKKPRP